MLLPRGWTAYCDCANDADADVCEDSHRWHYAVHYHEQPNTYTYVNKYNSEMFFPTAAPLSIHPTTRKHR
eukprot:504231-Pyramimonas_sp.AAC.1